MRVGAVVVLAISAPAWGANLLKNSGFEKLRADMPDAWNVFVAPQDGADGTVVGRPVHDGTFAVRLHNPEAYEKEPANNWSQNVIADVGEKSLRLSGYIRTEDATEAAIWLQAFRREPWTVLHVASTSTDTPVYGTRDWERVEMTVDVPRQTDFLVVRCVLLGHGTAWFDDIVLEEAKPGDKDENEKSKEPPRKGELASLDDILKKPEDGSKSKRDDEAVRSLRETRKALEETHETLRMMNETASDDAARRSLIETHEALMAANKQLLEMNRLLQQRLNEVQAELKQIREDLAKSTAPAPQQKPQPAPPPLVPHGVTWKEAAP